VEDRAPVRPAPESPAPPDAVPPDVPADAAAPRRPSIAVRALVAVLGFYRRWISPMFPPSCRFHPTCSAYGIEALRTHGVVIGTGLTLVRVAKCAPWHPGGLDPVPPRGDRTWCGWPRRAADPGGEAPHTEEREPC
jgi:uncharacterized protein